MAIKVENLTFKYPDGRIGIKDLTLNIATGKKTAILGLNGSGKSTLLYHFNGMNMPQTGSVEILDMMLNDSNLKEIRRKVGFLFDYPDHQLFSTTTYLDIEFGLDNYNFPSEKKDTLIKSIATKLDILDLLDKPPYQLSLGQKKKVAIAGIMVLEPDILVCDEPFSGLDYPSINFVIDILDKWTSQDKTIVFSTHDVNLAYEWADEIIIMEKGSIIFSGNAQEVLQKKELYELTELEKPYLLRLFENSDEKPINIEAAKFLIDKNIGGRK
ncbi:MAG: ABC transporter ATP-binding protein [Tissierellia bacterium]|nr:ABC transporter ATP-binding protein [Tissierellia bacterium]